MSTSRSGSTSTPPSMQLLSAGEVMKQPSPGWLIDGVLPESGLAMLYGPPGQGKTFVALSMVKAVVCGSPWLDKYRTLKGTVLYVAAEGGGGLRRRLEAQNFPKEGRDALFLLEPVYLSDPTHREALLAALTAEAAGRSRLIVIDTLGMSFVGDENSSRDIGELMRGATEIRNRTGAAILLIHHSVKGSTKAGLKGRIPAERGSSALLGALDTSMVLLPYNDQLRLYCRKQKDGEPFSPIDLRLACGTESCRVSFGFDYPDKQLSNRAMLALRALRDSQDGALRAKDWCHATLMPSSTFYKAAAELTERGYVVKYSNRYSVTDAGLALLSNIPLKLSA